MLDPGSFNQHGVFSSLTTSLEACLKLAFSSTNDLKRKWWWKEIHINVTKTARSAWEAPEIIFGTNDLCPGASKIVKCFFSVSKYARPTSTVLPFSRSSSFVSRAHDRYLTVFRYPVKHTNIIPSTYQLSRPFSFASRSYFSNVRLSTIPVKYISCPPIVDFPASTWPMKTILTRSLRFGSKWSRPTYLYENLTKDSFAPADKWWSNFHLLLLFFHLFL